MATVASDDAKTIRGRPKFIGVPEFLIHGQLEIGSVMRPAIIESQILALDDELRMSSGESRVLFVENEVGSATNEETGRGNTMGLEQPTIRSMMADLPSRFVPAHDQDLSAEPDLVSFAKQSTLAPLNPQPYARPIARIMNDDSTFDQIDLGVSIRHLLVVGTGEAGPCGPMMTSPFSSAASFATAPSRVNN